MTEEARGLPGGLGMTCGHPVEGGVLGAMDPERAIFSITLPTRTGRRDHAVALRTNEGTAAAGVPACGPPSEFIALFFFPSLSSSQHRQQDIYCCAYLTEDSKGWKATDMLGLGFRITLVPEKKNPLNRQCR